MRRIECGNIGEFGPDQFGRRIEWDDGQRWIFQGDFTRATCVSRDDVSTGCEGFKMREAQAFPCADGDERVTGPEEGRDIFSSSVTIASVSVPEVSSVRT